ncbi:MAG: undecaprenyl/decaprenyl-phosphate alpha-N-acetylglucosaminyl 1-phosphate transferase [Planctomycetes bacterium]|nr:undecaprenyl/decaprenyl-phosphate alpha-N-acetylglucosaminyl 1-phosphate transferase [Planctomycetota bacterium]
MYSLGSIVAIIATLMSVACNFGAIRFSRMIGLVSKSGRERWKGGGTPLAGGMAVWFCTTAMILWVAFAFGFMPEYFDLGEFATALRPLLPGIQKKFPDLLIILGVGTGVFVVGLIDDFIEMRPWLKLLLLTALSAILPLSGFTVTFNSEMPFVPEIVTTFWILALMNSFNLFDNMDGVLSALVLGIAAGMALIAVFGGQLFVLAIILVIVCVQVGFFIFNFPPAHSYLGDSGSLFLGYMFAVVSILLTFHSGDQWWLPVTMPILMFMLPLYDTMSVCWLRLRAGRSIFSGDTNHFTHRLAKLGLSNLEVIVVTLLMSTVTSIAGFLISRLDSELLHAMVLLLALLMVMIVIILEQAAERKKE